MFAALWLLVACAPALAAPPGAKQFDFALAKGSLSFVLEQFYGQTGLAVITGVGVAESGTHEIGPFVGHASADDALAQLLKDTNLSYRWEDASTITIFVTLVRPPRSEDNVHEVLVTGTRLHDETNGPAPIRVYGRTRLDRYGASSLAELSRYLTQQPYAFGAGHQLSGAQFFQLRGLGFDTTLVLINGRRMPPSANSLSLNAADINNIPLTAVQRVEVMSDSASAIYGADAIGGVVNIILKDRVETPEIYLHYGQAEGGGTQRRAAASFGTVNYRLKSALLLEYNDTNALMGEKRELWRNQDYRRFGGRDYRITAQNPGNVYSLTGQPLPGLSSSRAAIPARTTGSLTPADFFATDGGPNLASSLGDWSITPPSRRRSAYGTAEYSVGEQVRLFGEILTANSDLTALRSPPSVIRQLVPASNPYNPFDVPVAVDYLFAGMDPISYLYKSALLRLVAGARGAMHRWEWEITGLHHREDVTNTSRGVLSASRVAAAVSSEDPETALNLFSDGPAGSAALLDSLVATPSRSHFSFSSAQWSAFIRGPIFSVGERQAEAVVGGEWRRDAAGFVEFGKPLDVDRDIASAFTEIRVPLLDTLSLKIAARGDDYGEGTWAVNPQYGLTWRPAKDWLFRAAYGTSFRPPSLFELYLPTFQAALPVADPSRAGEVSNVSLIMGGNPHLEVVTARSFTTGFVFHPSQTPGLRLGASYWRIVIDNRIMAPIYQELIKPGSVVSNLVMRDPPTPQDLQTGWPGRVRSINISRINYGDLDTSGIDADASLPLEGPWGHVNLDLAVTWVNHYRSRDMNQVLPLDRVGIANVAGTIPEWRVVGTVGWTRDETGVSTTATFTPAYQDADWGMGPIDRRINAQALVDVQAWCDLKVDSSAMLDGTRLTLGARNVFDQMPEFAKAGASFGYDFSQSEITGRFLYVRLGKRF